MALPICCRRPLSLLPRTTIPQTFKILSSNIQRASYANIVTSTSDNSTTSSNKLASGPLTISDQDRSFPEYEAEEDVPKQLQNVDPELRPVLAKARLSKALQLLYLKPLRRKPTHGIVVCDLQIRSFNARNLELYCDFAMRAAYYLGLAAKGPVPLPKIMQRYTVIRSNFVHKKSQENFERVHLRRLIQIQDGDPVAVQCWLGYLQRKQYHGTGMKANLYEHEGLGVGKRMDEQAGIVDDGMDDAWGNIGIRMNATTAEKVEELLDSEAFAKPRRDLEAFYREPIEIKRKKPL